MILIKTKLKPSELNGIGVFSEEFIPKGKLLWKFNSDFDLVLPREQVDQLSDAAKEQFLHYAYLSKKTGRYVLCSDDSRFFNHQDQANTICEVPPNSASGEALYCFAVRDIYKGEELTNNYRDFDEGFLGYNTRISND